MSYQIILPADDGSSVPYILRGPSLLSAHCPPSRVRRAYAAAHIVGRPGVSADQPVSEQIDWEATLAYRRVLWSLGLSVAEAMDTAQRGMGLTWEAAQELIQRSARTAAAEGTLDRLACGAGTDQLTISPTLTLVEVIAAYEEQCAFVEDQGTRVILMASRALAACARSPEDYLSVYDRVLSQVRRPVILHWLGAMFDPALTGYWGHTDLDQATEVCLSIIQRHAAKIDGIKLSLLSAEREIALRRRLPAGVAMYTGDDFNYMQLIRGDGQGYSHALLGIFDAIAPAAAAALQALDRGDMAQYETILAPTIPLSRHIFQEPTYYYKTGIVFLAYLNGHQEYFCMPGGLAAARSVSHLARLFVLADQAGLLVDPELAIARMRHILMTSGGESNV